MWIKKTVNLCEKMKPSNNLSTENVDRLRTLKRRNATIYKQNGQRKGSPHLSKARFPKWHAHLLLPEPEALFSTFQKMPLLHQYP